MASSKRFSLCLAFIAALALALLLPPSAMAMSIPGDKRRDGAPQTPQATELIAPACGVEPVIPLTEYQANWVNDKSRFKIGVITRQGGKSFSTSLEAVLDCLEHKAMWVLLSAGERQSKELMGKAALHAKAAGMVVQEIEGEFWADKDTKYKQLEIVFPNGSRIVGLPANPDTARGWSANIILDEFALHRDTREIWKAMFPTVTRGYKIRVISTFRGKNNKFYELFFSAPTKQRQNGRDFEYVGERGGWSKHLVSIHMAVEMGLELKDEDGERIEPDDLRLALNDDDAWEEEFECVPSDEATAFLSHDMISAVEDVRISKSPDWVAQLIEIAKDNFLLMRKNGQRPDLSRIKAHLATVPFGPELFLGMDIGRKRDFSVIWLDEKINGLLRTVAVIELKKMPFFVQEQVLQGLLSLPGVRRGCIDETGIGAQLAEDAQTICGSGKVEAVSFTPGNKEAMAVGLKQNFEDHGSAIPADSTVRGSLHSVKKYATTTKHFRFDAERTDETGHADHFWAKALCTQATSIPTAPIEFKSTGRRRPSTGGGMAAYMEN